MKSNPQEILRQKDSDQLKYFKGRTKILKGWNDVIMGKGEQGTGFSTRGTTKSHFWQMGRVIYRSPPSPTPTSGSNIMGDANQTFPPLGSGHKNKITPQEIYTTQHLYVIDIAVSNVKVEA